MKRVTQDTMNRSLVLILLAILATVTCDLTFPPPKTTVPNGCDYRGNHYMVGQQFQPSPCEHCFCDVSGRAICAIGDCFFSPCVDAVFKPDQCCPVCPTGENCRAPDGTIVKKGEKVTLSDGSVCQCDSTFSWGQPEARCAISFKPPTVAPS